LGRALAIGLLAAFAWQIRIAAEHFIDETHYDYSANQRLAALLRGEPDLANAVVMGEPDTPLWSVPYYADNRIYIPREQTFRPWGIFAESRRYAYALQTLLDDARRAHESCGCPVIVTLGWELDDLGVHRIFGGSQFEEAFRIDAGARDAIRAATQYLGRLGPSITDEAYDVYVLR